MRKKICIRCVKEKPIKEFNKHPECSDGHVNQCKSCVKERQVKNGKEWKNYRGKRKGIDEIVKTAFIWG